MADVYKKLGSHAFTDSGAKVLIPAVSGKSQLVSNITVLNKSTTDEINFSIFTEDSVLTDGQLINYYVTRLVAAPNWGEAGIGENILYLSVDGGTTWTSHTIPALASDEPLIGMITSDNYIFILSERGNIYRTQDGNSWETVLTGAGVLYNGYAKGPTIFVPEAYKDAENYNEADSVYVSYDYGTTWTKYTLPEVTLTAIESASPGIYREFSLGGIVGNTFVVGCPSYSDGSRSVFTTTTDFITWTTPVVGPVGNSRDYYGTSYVVGDKLFMPARGTASSSSVSLFTYTTGTGAIAAAVNQLNTEGFAVGGTTLVLLGIAEDSFVKVAVSSDSGATFTKYQYPATQYDNKDIFWTGSKFLGVSNTTLYESTDGITWTQKTVENWDSMLNPVAASASLGYGGATPSSRTFTSSTILPGQTEIIEPGIIVGDTNSLVVASDKGNLVVSAYGTQVAEATKYKKLGSSAVASTFSAETPDVSVYRLDTAKEFALVRSLIITNNSGSSSSIRVALVDANNPIRSVADKDYIYYDYELNARETLIVKAGYTMAPGDAIKFSYTGGAPVISVFGMEV